MWLLLVGVVAGLDRSQEPPSGALDLGGVQLVSDSPSVGSVTSVVAGGSHTCTRLTDGSVRCWGFNSSGQLGDGTTIQRPTPVEVSGLSDAVALSAGDGHTCALVSGGTVVCWGSNSFGQLGIGSTNSSSVPMAVGGLSGVVSITAGWHHTCALLVSGEMKCWGFNAFGQIGDGSYSQHNSPEPVLGLSGVVQMAAGYGHTCARLSDGTVRCWGLNGDGQLGDNSVVGSPSPVTVSGLTTAIDLRAGSAHGCARLADGDVVCWGDNDVGQLGDGSTVDRSVPVAIVGSARWATLSTGAFHTCAVAGDSTASCWGFNGDGALGDGSSVDRHEPTVVGSARSLAGVAAGGQHTCAWTEVGAVQCWGSNFNGQLGDGTTTGRSTPTVAIASRDSLTPLTPARLADTRPTGTTIDGERQRSGPLGENGTLTVRVLGRGGVPATGVSAVAINLTAVSPTSGGFLTVHPTGEPRPTSSNLNLSPGQTVANLVVAKVGIDGSVTIFNRTGTVNVLVDVQGWFADDASGGGWIGGPSTTGQHTCAIASGGAVMCWGRGHVGQLGSGVSGVDPRSATPVSVSSIGGASMVSAGGGHTCALVGSQVWCWGFNGDGELGDGTTNTKLTPTTSSSLDGYSISGARSVSTGVRTTCVVMVDGTVRCWGANGSGQLGDGSTVQRSSPSVVPGLTGVVAVSAGSSHTCAVTVDGTVQCWGANESGQLGDGSTVQRSSPSVVPGLSGVSKLGASSCALMLDGSVRCWGWGYGLSPATVPGYERVSEVSGSCFRTNVGSLHCQGDNTYGQVGDGTFIRRNSPVEVAHPSSPVQIALGEEHACARTSDGAAWCWGNNGAGQLGTGRSNGFSGCGSCRFDEYVPVRASVAPGAVLDVAVGSETTCTLEPGAVIKCFGLASISPHPAPYVLAGPADTVDIEVSAQRVCARRASGTVSCALPSGGQFTEVAGLTGVTAITRGGAYGDGQWCALVGGGGVSCWDPVLGIAPAPVAGVSGAIGLAMAPLQSCVVLVDGTVSCWGRGRATATPVDGLSGVLQVAIAGTRSSSEPDTICARQDAGTISCWDDSGTDRIRGGPPVHTTPALRPGVTDAVQLEMRDSNTCVRTSSGAISCWSRTAGVAWSAGRGMSPSPGVAPVAVLGRAPQVLSPFSSVVPARLADTRANCTLPCTIDGQMARGGRIGPEAVLHVPVVGRGGVPASGVGTVVVNVTAVAPSTGGFMTVFPKGASRPTASNLNLVAGRTTPNLVVAKVGADGSITVFNKSGTVDVLVDVQGWFPDDAVGFSSLVPARLADTRMSCQMPCTIDGSVQRSGVVGENGELHVPVLGRGGIPASGVGAVVVNVTAVAPSTGGFVTVYPKGESRPTASNLNFLAGRTTPNLVVAKVGADGSITVFNRWGTVDVLVDVQGWFPG